MLEKIGEREYQLALGAFAGLGSFLLRDGVSDAVKIACIAGIVVVVSVFAVCRTIAKRGRP